VLAGAVQDFMILFISTRRDGRSLGEMVKAEMGPVAGLIALFGTFMIMIIILAVLALIVVKALSDSPWGMFTVVSTLPIAVFMGIWMRFIRPGRVGGISVVGFVLLIGAILLGGPVAASPTWAPLFTFTGTELAWILIGYGFVAAALPVCGWCWRRATTCPPSSRLVPLPRWPSASCSSLLTCGCRRRPV